MTAPSPAPGSSVSATWSSTCTDRLRGSQGRTTIGTQHTFNGGLCIARGGLVIGSESTSTAQCTALGGKNAALDNMLTPVSSDLGRHALPPVDEPFAPLMGALGVCGNQRTAPGRERTAVSFPGG